MPASEGSSFSFIRDADFSDVYSQELERSAPVQEPAYSLNKCTRNDFSLQERPRRPQQVAWTGTQLCGTFRQQRGAGLGNQVVMQGKHLPLAQWPQDTIT